MNGSFGNDPQNDDGALAETQTANKNGLVGINSASGPAGSTPGQPPEGNGVLAVSQTKDGSGLFAVDHAGKGVSAFSDNGIGIFAQGGVWSGVFNGALVVSKAPTPPNQSNINGCIVINDGDLFVNTGNIRIAKGDVFLANGDCAEEFEAAIPQIEPGTVVVLDDGGAVRPSSRAYDKRVAGVISGAGSYRPAIVLDKREASPGRVPVSFLGKVFCNVDADYGAIEVGDLLTTSATYGHAMRVSDPLAAFGAVIGKALRPLAVGRGSIPMLVALQ